MFINNNSKPILLIGYKESSLTQEMLYLAHEADDTVETISPENFKNLKNKQEYQFIVSFGLDLDERNEIVEIAKDYDVPSYVHSTSYVADKKSIGRGTCVGPFSTVMQSASVGDHTIIETYCLISHYTRIGDNCIIHAGTKIAGKTEIGNNVMLNFNSTVINKLKVKDYTVLGASSTLTKSVETPGIYVGTPARLLKERGQS